MASDAACSWPLVFTLSVVVTSMLSMGLGLTIAQVIDPLRNVRLIVLALAANSVVVPLAAWLASRVIPLTQDLQIGLLLLGTAAGAPFLPKLAQIAKASVPFAVGLMALLQLLSMPLQVGFMIGLGLPIGIGHAFTPSSA